MTTSNLGLDNSLTSLTEGQEQKEAAINSNTAKLISNMGLLDESVPVFMGEFPSNPTSGTAALGSSYFNTSDSTLYVLLSKTPDTWYTPPSSSGGSSNWGDIGGVLSNQTDLQNALNGKADTNHTHTKSDITDFSDGDYATSAQGAKADSALQDLTTESIQSLSDVGAMTPSSGQVLTYQSGEWTAADSQGGSAGGGSTFVEQPFRPTIVGRFGKNNTPALPSHSNRAIWNTTAHTSTNNIIVNVFCPSLGSLNNTLTFFKVDGDSFSVINSQLGIITNGSSIWVDISGDGQRVAIGVRTSSGADEIVILHSTDDWATFNVEQTILLQQDEVITSVALNYDGSRVWFATGSNGVSSVTSRVGYYDRVGSAWTYGEDAYSTTNLVNLILMFGQQADNVVGFQSHDTTISTEASHHIYQKSGTWSEIWSQASVNIGDGNGEADIISNISADGNVVFYRTGGTTAAIDVDVLTTPSTISIVENLAGSDAPFGLSADGKNVWYNTSNANDGRIWTHYIDGTRVDEIGFSSYNYEVVRPYGMQQHYMRPSKTGHYMLVGTTSGTYIDDAIFAGVPDGEYVNPQYGIKY